MIIGKDFKFRDDIKADTTPVELVGGPFPGVVVRFTTVSIQEQKNETATIKFDYEIFESGNETMVGLRKNPVFNEYIGLILNSMILEAIDAAENRTNNTTELIEE